MSLYHVSSSEHFITIIRVYQEMDTYVELEKPNSPIKHGLDTLSQYNLTHENDWTDKERKDWAKLFDKVMQEAAAWQHLSNQLIPKTGGKQQ